MPMPVKSLFVPQGLSGVAVAVNELDGDVVVLVKEVVIPLVKATNAEATKFQSLATNSRLWLLQQLGCAMCFYTR